MGGHKENWAIIRVRSSCFAGRQAQCEAQSWDLFVRLRCFEAKAGADAATATPITANSTNTKEEGQPPVQERAFFGISAVDSSRTKFIVSKGGAFLLPSLSRDFISSCWT